MDFVYLECPECEFSAVIRPTGKPSFCPMCAGDNGRDVRMREREATAFDNPEGADERVMPE